MSCTSAYRQFARVMLVVSALSTALFMLTLTACSFTENLGDGKVAGVVPVSVISAGAAAAGQPGVAAGIDKGEAILKAIRKTKEQGGLPPPQFGPPTYRTNITVQLTNGTWLTSREIRKVRKEVVQIPPEPFVEEFSADEIVTQVAVGKKKTADMNDIVKAVAEALQAAGVPAAGDPDPEIGGAQPDDTAASPAPPPAVSTNRTAASLVDDIIEGRP